MGRHFSLIESGGCLSMGVSVGTVCSCMMLLFTCIALLVAIATVDFGRKWVDQAPFPGQKVRIRVGVTRVCSLIDGLEEECSDLKNESGSKKLYTGGRVALVFGMLCVVLMIVEFSMFCFSDPATRKKIAACFAIAACVFTTIAWVVYAAYVFTSDEWKKASVAGKDFKFDISWSWIGLVPTTIMTANAAGLIAGEDI